MFIKLLTNTVLIKLLGPEPDPNPDPDPNPNPNQEQKSRIRFRLKKLRSSRIRIRIRNTARYRYLIVQFYSCWPGDVSGNMRSSVLLARPIY